MGRLGVKTSTPQLLSPAPIIYHLYYFHNKNSNDKQKKRVQSMMKLFDLLNRIKAESFPSFFLCNLMFSLETFHTDWTAKYYYFFSALLWLERARNIPERNKNREKVWLEKNFFFSLDNLCPTPTCHA